MGELAPLLVCEASNVTGVTDRLEKRGLVERRAAPHDRRVRMLALTEAGVRLRQTIVERMLQPLPAFEHLSDEQQETLRELLAFVARESLAAQPYASRLEP